MNLLTIQETADFLRVHHETVRKWVRQGKLKIVRVNKEPRIDKDFLLNEFIKEEKWVSTHYRQ